ncbi:DUF2190 family protein [Thiolapillus sp.]
MTWTYVDTGGVIQVAASTSISAGDPVVIAQRVAVSLQSLSPGEIGAAHVAGVFAAPKGSSVYSQGDLVYWDDAAKESTSVSAGNTLAGYAFGPAAAGDTKVNIRLNG